MQTIHPSPTLPRWPAALSRARKASRAVLCALLFAPAVVAIPATSPAQTAPTLTALHSFTGSDGAGSGATLLQTSDGNFYGTTAGGGSGNNGTVFSITPAGALTTLHTFTGTDGEDPQAALVQGSDGNFYGTTRSGGSGSGTVFSITPAGMLTTLYSFSATSFDANYVNGDGAYPQAVLLQGSDGNFYGTTSRGGSGGTGTVFSITPAGVLTTLHTFSAYDEGANSDGAGSDAALVQGSDGNFYGTTSSGGTADNGTVFKITPAGVFSTLHTFSAYDEGANSDGGGPTAALVQGSDGNFYGTTSVGGSGSGTVFKITPADVLTTLHTFTYSGTDGGVPFAALVQGSNGSFYGTTSRGGSGGAGTVFSITPAGVLTTLHTFSALDDNNDNSDGANPFATLVQGSNGSFYGTTSSGGSGGDGTVFELTVPGLHPAFFDGETALSNGVYYLAFPNNGNIFGYYNFYDADDSHYLYHYDLGFEYVQDAADGHAGVYLYDFTSNTFWYTSPTFPFPYLYDFTLKAILYYYPDPTDPQRYNTNGVRYFYNFSTNQIISK